MKAAALDRKVPLKSVLAVFAMLCILFHPQVYTTIYYALAQSSPLGSAGTASYIIYKSGNTYYAIDGTTGTELTSGTDGDAVIQATLDSLATGRTWKEKVVIKGNIEIDNTIDIPSYTILEIQGNLTLANNADIYMLASSSSMYIDIIGGIINGNKASNTIGGGIFFSGVAYSSIFSSEILNGAKRNIVLINSSAIRIINCRIQASGEHGILLDSSHRNLITSNFFKDNLGYDIVLESEFNRSIRSSQNLISNNVFWGANSSAIRLEDGSSLNAIIGNTINNCAGFSVHIFNGSTHNTVSENIISLAGRELQIEDSSYNIIIHNIIKQSGDNGITIFANTDKAQFNVIQGNTIFNSKFHGIRIHSSGSHHAGYNIISGNICSENGQDSVQTYDGIDMINSTFNTISNNLCTGSQQRYGIHEEQTSNNNIIINNRLMHNGLGALSTVGSNTIVKFNDGFVTENRGTATNLANGGTIPHGLAGKPTVVMLTCLNATYDGELVLVYWDEVNTDRTNISVDIYWANGTAISDSVIDVSWDAKYEEGP